LKTRFTYFLICLCTFFAGAQTSIFKEKNKWGIKEGNGTLVPAVYDTIFNFDSTGKVCLACMKLKMAHPNKFIKTPLITYNCSYLNKKKERLVIKLESGDTSGVFTLHKNSYQQYAGMGSYMTVPVKDKNLMDHKYLVDKDLKQITFKAYEDIHVSPVPEFLLARIRDEGNTVREGMLTRAEEIIIDYKYSFIKFNTTDSLIIGCTAGLGGMNSEDDIYIYTGKKIASYHRHIELAMKKFVVEKIFQPKEYLVILNLENKEEQIEHAEEVHYFLPEKLLMMNDDHWYTYDLHTHKKKTYDMKHKKEEK
jgi:hypothetical protein